MLSYAIGDISAIKWIFIYNINIIGFRVIRSSKVCGAAKSNGTILINNLQYKFRGLSWGYILRILNKVNYGFMDSFIDFILDCFIFV